jgi:hypothetical protein
MDESRAEKLLLAAVFGLGLLALFTLKVPVKGSRLVPGPSRHRR